MVSSSTRAAALAVMAVIAVAFDPAKSTARVLANNQRQATAMGVDIADKVAFNKFILDRNAALQKEDDLFKETFGDVTPGFAVGSPFVPQTGVALVHQGERIFSAADNKSLIEAVSNLSNGGSAGGNNAPNITVNVQGNVVSEFDLVQSIRDGIRIIDENEFDANVAGVI